LLYRDPKKIAEALNTIPRIEGLGTCVLHLEEEEIFGNQKKIRCTDW